MAHNEVTLAEIALLQVQLEHRARICYAMIIAGVVCLFAGIVMLVVGITGQQVVWFESGTVKVTAGGFGAVTMLASVVWGFLAYRSRPVLKYRGLGNRERGGIKASVEALPPRLRRKDGTEPMM